VGNTVSYSINLAGNSKQIAGDSGGLEDEFTRLAELAASVGFELAQFFARLP
jgi:hypothetical protein